MDSIESHKFLFAWHRLRRSHSSIDLHDEISRSYAAKKIQFMTPNGTENTFINRADASN